MQLVSKPLLNLVRFVVTEQSVVDEDARQSIANRAMNEHRRDGRIHTAREPAYLARPDLLTNALRRLLDERADRPVAGAAAFAISEIPQDLDAVFRVHDFRVEQQRIQLPLGCFHRHDRRRGACCGTANPGGTAPTSSPWLAHTLNSLGT